MSVCSSIVCPECGKLYDDSTRRPCIGKCNHTICLLCKDSLELSKCPICKDSDAFPRVETVFNYGTINFLTDFQKTLTEDDLEKFNESLKDLGAGPCSKCNSSCKKLRICTECTPFVVKSTNGKWRASFWLVGRNASLKAKSAAICSNCVIDYHEEHEVIELMQVEGIAGHFEVEHLIHLRFLIESNWQRDIDAGKTTLEAMYPRRLALQWKFEERLTELRRSFYLGSEQLISNHNYQNWKPQLEKSLAAIKRYQRIVEDLRKFNMMNQKWTIFTRALNIFFTRPPTKQNRKEVRETVENYELLPTEVNLISHEAYRYYDRCATRKLIKLTVEMAEKHPDRRNDRDYLRCEVIKEQVIKTKEGIVEIDKECNRHLDNFIDHLNQKLETEESHYQTVQLQLQLDRACLEKLKLQADEQLASIIIEKCLNITFMFKYFKEIQKVIHKYENVAFKMDIDSVK